METLLAYSNQTHRRFRAVDGSQLLVNTTSSSLTISHPYLSTFVDSSLYANHHLNLPPTQLTGDKAGEIGCWLSYLFLMREMAARESASNRPLVILEDDVDLDVNFARHIRVTINSAPDDWDILLCGYCCLRATDYKTELLRGVVSYFATHCFIVRNSTTAERIASKLEHDALPTAIDRHLSRLASEK